MNKAEALKERIETISEDGQYYKRTSSDTASRILKACKEALPTEEIKIRLTQYMFGDITSDQFVESIEEVFGE